MSKLDDGVQYKKSGARALQYLFAEVLARRHQLVLEDAPGGERLAPAAVWLQQLAEQLQRHPVALRVDHVPGEEEGGDVKFNLWPPA